MATFTWTPDFDADGATEPQVKAIKFGDGYEQRASSGLNTIQKKWSLTFVNRDPVEGNAILDFLTARKGIESFDWTPPFQSAAKKWVCRKWKERPMKGSFLTISADFEQVFEP